jgi:hypothetical protein
VLKPRTAQELDFAKVTVSSRYNSFRGRNTAAAGQKRVQLPGLTVKIANTSQNIANLRSTSKKSPDPKEKHPFPSAHNKSVTTPRVIEMQAKKPFRIFKYEKKVLSTYEEPTYRDRSLVLNG